MAIEAENGDIITIISERTGVNYGPSHRIRSYLLIFSSQGDTMTKYYSLGDTLFQFTLIDRAFNSGYLLAGSASIQDTDELYLVLMRVDDELNRVWVSYHDMSEYFGVAAIRLFLLNNKYLIAFETCTFPCNRSSHNLVWLDTLGNIKSTYIYEHKSRSNSDYLLNHDSTRIWCFSPGLSVAGGYGWQPRRMVFDTALQYLGSQNLPIGGYQMTAKWHTDSTLVYSCDELRPSGGGSHDSEMWIIACDSMLNLNQSNYFGAYDTTDIPGFRNNLDLRHPDTVFFAGLKHQRIGKPPPGRVSWIMTGQTDAQLQPRYLHFIGGDHYYETYYILATRDGGSFICAARFNHETQVYDPVFLKLNSEGLLVSTTQRGIQLKESLIYPNPAHDHVIIESYLPAISIKIHDLSGRIVNLQNAWKGKTAFDISVLKPGTYIISIYSHNQFVESQKFVKH